jgi:hypothetical protein
MDEAKALNQAKRSSLRNLTRISRALERQRKRRNNALLASLSEHLIVSIAILTAREQGHERVAKLLDQVRTKLI